jgi:hypothetical protein
VKVFNLLNLLKVFKVFKVIEAREGCGGRRARCGWTIGGLRGEAGRMIRRVSVL